MIAFLKWCLLVLVGAQKYSSLQWAHMIPENLSQSWVCMSAWLTATFWKQASCYCACKSQSCFSGVSVHLWLLCVVGFIVEGQEWNTLFIPRSGHSINGGGGNNTPSPHHLFNKCLASARRPPRVSPRKRDTDHQPRGWDQFYIGSAWTLVYTSRPGLPEEPGMETAQDSNKVLSFTKETDVTYQTNLRDG